MRLSRLSLVSLVVCSLSLLALIGCNGSSGGGAQIPDEQADNNTSAANNGGKADSVDPESPFGKARRAFAQAVAQVHDVELSSLSVQPNAPDLPNSAFDAHKVGDLLAFRADYEGNDPGPRGFASASGEVALIGHTKGLSALLEACRINDAEASLPAEEIVGHLVWVYRSKGELVDIHETITEIDEPRIERSEGASTLTYYTEAAGDTGAKLYFRVRVQVGADYATDVEFTAL